MEKSPYKFFVHFSFFLLVTLHFLLENVQCCLFCVFTGFYHFLSIGSTCSPNEYRSAYGECCPMCNPGSVVHSDCSEDVSTTCKPCPPGTFVNEPNGLHLCFTCKHCAESQGLYIQSKCTTIKNTICDVLDGYYCIDYSNSQCRHAEKHRVCRPGQETKTPGTKASDTECVDCAPGFYSPSGLNCTKWTDCAARNRIQTEGGSPEKDVTCELKPKERYSLVDLIAASFAEFYRSFFSEVQKANNGKWTHNLF
uniref:TNFR-Cys domain-containing protein n=1 Tax=Sinocyclocheilus grahami TaxID=75366 RepID=A0A672LT74_SINGR